MHHRSRIATITILALAVLMLTALPCLAGQATMKWKAVSHVSDVHLMTMPDDENHIMGIYEHTGVALMGNGENTVFLDRGDFDMYVPEGTHAGYVKITFPDNSSFDFKYQGREFRKKGSDLPFIKGTGEFIKGSGRFKNIKGALTYEGGYITPYDKEKCQVGDSVVDYEATYTLGR